MNRDQLSFLLDIQTLKRTYRATGKNGWYESTAAHSWSLAFLVLHLRHVEPELHLERALKLALCHDLVEIYAGDVDFFSGDTETERNKEEREEAAAQQLSTHMPELYDLWKEFENRETLEGKFVHALDRIEPMLTHLWLGTAYYREKNITSHYMLSVKRELMTDSLFPVLQHVTAVLEQNDLMHTSPDPVEILDSGMDLDFLLKMQELKQVDRSMYFDNRTENSAEHSWGLAFLVLYFAHLKPNLDMTKALQMALVHDIVEIETGDIVFYDLEARKQKAKEEQIAADTLFINYPALRYLWQEYETGETDEAKFVKALDKIEPMCLNVATNGESWQTEQVPLKTVRKLKGPYVSKELQPIMNTVLDYAEEYGMDYRSYR